MLQTAEGMSTVYPLLASYNSLTNHIIDDQLKDMCPICKTDKYLSPNMKFLINPECYHKICESCVDRIFSLGPAPCPYPKCGKILRKNKFKQQIFEDLIIEKKLILGKKYQQYIIKQKKISLEIYKGIIDILKILRI